MSEYRLNPLTGKFDEVANSVSDIADLPNYYERLDGTNQPSTGNKKISKVNPVLELEDTTDNYSTYIKKVDANHLGTYSSEVDYTSVDSNVKLLMHCDGSDGGTTFTDSSQYARSLTAVGSVTTKTDQKEFGTAAAYFTGAVQNQHVLIPHSTDFDLGTTNFDVSMWVRFDTIAAGTEVILCKRNNADFDLGFIEIQRSGANIILYATSNGTSFDIASAKVFGTVSANTWHYVRVSRVGSGWYMSIDGVQSAQNFTSSASVRTNTDAMALGSIPGQTIYTVTGYIDEVYIAIGAGVSGDTGNFTPPTMPWGVNQVECIGLSIQDSTATGEQGIVTLGGNATKSIINGNNPRFSVAGVEQFNLTDGAIVPTTDNDIDLGSATKEYKDGYIDGILYVDAIKQADSEKHYSGTGDDMSIDYDGTQGNIKTNLVAPSDLHVACGTDKTIVLDETVWDDLQFEISSGMVGVANFPDWDTAFTTNTGEYKFDVNDYIDLSSEEVPHTWKIGTDGSVHLHISLDGANSSGGNQYAKFTVYLAYADVGEVWTETSLTAELTIPNGTADRTYLILTMGTLTLTNQIIGNQIKPRIKRIAATGGTEYPNHIFVNQMGIHLEQDTMGSRQVATK